MSDAPTADAPHPDAPTWPAPTRADHDRFCQTEGWIQVRDGDRVTYELGLSDGRVLRTRLGTREVYGPEFWQHVLADQLSVDEAAFWACVQDGEVPDRGLARPRPDALPVELVHLLISRVGLPEREVAALSRKEAIARLDTYWYNADQA